MEKNQTAKMSFTKNHIHGKKLYIIDIGTYKLRGISVILKNKNLHILDYVEKRQDTSYFVNNECTNLRGLSENIGDIIRQLDYETEENETELVFTYPFGEIFTSSKTLNYKRDTWTLSLKIDELEKIISSVEKLCLKKVESDIHDNYGRELSDLHIILSKVGHIKIDGEHHTKIIGRTWEHLNIQLQNIFIPRDKYESLIKIWKTLGRGVFKVLPSEYCTPNIFKEANLCSINIGANTTSISLKKDNQIASISKIPLWIWHLIEKIHSERQYSKSQIIEWLDSDDNFIKEKIAFCNILQRSIWVTLSEMLGESICPDLFFISGGADNNVFIKEAIKNIDFQKYNVKITKQISFLTEDMSKILSHIEHISLEHIRKIPIDMYGLLLETKNILQNEGDVVSSSLENVLHKLGY